MRAIGVDRIRQYISGQFAAAEKKPSIQFVFAAAGRLDSVNPTSVCKWSCLPLFADTFPPPSECIAVPLAPLEHCLQVTDGDLHDADYRQLHPRWPSHRFDRVLLFLSLLVSFLLRFLFLTRMIDHPF